MIRRAGPEDTCAIASVHERSRAGLSFLPRLHSSEEHRSWLGRVVAEQEVWVWEDGAVVSFVVLDDATVDHLYVEPASTGLGIGSALLDHAKKRRSRGFTLWTFQRNDGARRFYERHGLRPTRSTSGEGNEERLPDVLYEWRPPRETSGRAL